MDAENPLRQDEDIITSFDFVSAGIALAWDGVWDLDTSMGLTTELYKCIYEEQYKIAQTQMGCMIRLDDTRRIADHGLENDYEGHHIIYSFQGPILIQ